MTLYKSSPAARAAVEFARDAGIKDPTAVKAYAEGKIAPALKGLSDNATAAVTRAALKHMQAPPLSVDAKERAKAAALEVVMATQGIGRKRKSALLLQRLNTRLKAETPEAHAFMGASGLGNDPTLIRAAIEQQSAIDAVAARAGTRNGFKPKVPKP